MLQMHRTHRTHRLIVGLVAALGCLALLAGPLISLPAPAQRPVPTAGNDKPGADLLGQASRTLSKLRNEFSMPQVRRLALR